MKIISPFVLALLAVDAATAFVPNSCRIHSGNAPTHTLPTSTTACFASEVDSEVSSSTASSSTPKFPFSDRQVRFAYDEWRLIYGKGDYDEKRFQNFKTNHKTLVISNLKAREKAANDGRPMPQWMSLNEYGDYSLDEYEAMMRGEDPRASDTSSSSSSSPSYGYEAGEQPVRATQAVNGDNNYNNGQGEEYQDQFGRTIRSTQQLQQDASLEAAASINYANNIDENDYDTSRGTLIIPNDETVVSQRETQVIAADSGSQSRGTQVIGTGGATPSRGTQVIGTGDAPQSRGTQVIASDSASQSRGTQVIGTGGVSQSRGTQVIASDSPNQSRGTQVVSGGDRGGTQVVRSGTESYGTQVLQSGGEDAEFDSTGGTQIIPKNSNNEGTLIIPKNDNTNGEGGTQIIPKGDAAGGTQILPKSNRGTVVIGKDNDNEEDKGDDALSFLFGILFGGDSETKEEDPEEAIGKRGTMVIKRSIKAPEQKKPKNLFDIFGSGSDDEKEEEEEKEAENKPKSNDFFGFLNYKEDTKAKEEEAAAAAAAAAKAKEEESGGIFSLFGGTVKTSNPRPVRTSISLKQQAPKKASGFQTQRQTQLIPDQSEAETGMPSILSFFGGAKKVDEKEATTQNPNSSATLFVKKPPKNNARSTQKEKLAAARLTRQKQAEERFEARKAKVRKEREAKRLEREEKMLAATKRREAQARATGKKVVTNDPKPPKTTSPFPFFGAIGIRAEPPTLKKWRQNRDGSITGLIYDSKSFKDGTRITTSPVPRGAKRGTVVKTGGGSRYSLM